MPLTTIEIDDVVILSKDEHRRLIAADRADAPPASRAANQSCGCSHCRMRARIVEAFPCHGDPAAEPPHADPYHVRTAGTPTRPEVR